MVEMEMAEMEKVVIKVKVVMEQKMEAMEEVVIAAKEEEVMAVKEVTKIQSTHALNMNAKMILRSASERKTACRFLRDVHGYNIPTYMILRKEENVFMNIQMLRIYSIASLMIA